MSDKLVRILVTEDDLQPAIEDAVEHLLSEIKEKGAGAFVTSHELYGVLAEEMNKELLDAIHEKQYGCVDAFRMNHIYEELNDIVTAALFGMACIKSGKMTC